MPRPSSNPSQRAHHWGYVVLALAIQAGLGWLDYYTGPRLGFSLFYILPIVASGWWLGRHQAAAIALVGAVSWYWAEAYWYGAIGASTWNGFTRLAIYVGMGYLVAAVRSQRDELRRMVLEQAALARIDALTGLTNPRGFEERLIEMVAASRRSGEPLGVAFIDLDNFKAVNDHYGHAMGDEILKRIADEVREVSRRHDLVARVGGDELVAACPGADADALEVIAQRVATAVSAVGSTVPDARLGASIGLVHLNDGEDAQALLARADAAMYEAKRARQVPTSSTPPS
ncbi:MAG TPA: GGDEF domain-containing protein [Kofleriaceae bacterium]|nr:GGDEF domain-containing protein [Kofleriaceae bacterium]